MGSKRRSLLARVRGRSLRYLAQYGALRLTARLDARQLEFPLLPEDLADSAALAPHVDRRADSVSAPRVAWLAIPPSAGSGGHTTQFRMMQAAQDAGQHTTLLLYDRHNGDFERHAAIIRAAWPWLESDIRPVERQIRGYDAVVATSWPTAHVVAARAVEGRRLYFIQDYEPLFLARGADNALAEDSYRFGFRNIALGKMVHRLIRDELAQPSDLVPFGCDTKVYHALDPAPRRGVVFYCKQGNDRRGARLAIAALRIFHAAHPDEPIHVYGDSPRDLPFPATLHGTLSPQSLNELYNTVVAGLALSFTNISLVAEELLAAGVVAVVNDSPLARADLDNPHAVWALATPSELARALGECVRRPDRDGHAARVAASVGGRSWEPTQSLVTGIVADELDRARARSVIDGAG